MDKINNFLNKNGLLVIVSLLLILFLRTCSINGKIQDLQKDNNKRLDSLSKDINIKFSKMIRDIKIEGLKSEKRMIQSTDRKMLDVNRQTEIDKEIEILQKQ